MARAYASHGIHQGSDVSRLAEQIAEMEKTNVDKGGRPGDIIRKYQTNPPADLPQARLAAFLANGIVQAEADAANNDQAIKGYDPAQPSVLAQKEQAMQGVAGLPVRDGMYSPEIYARGGIGMMPEEEQPTYGVAGGGLIAFKRGGEKGEKQEEETPAPAPAAEDEDMPWWQRLALGAGVGTAAGASMYRDMLSSAAAQAAQAAPAAAQAAPAVASAAPAAAQAAAPAAAQAASAAATASQAAQVATQAAQVAQAAAPAAAQAAAPASGIAAGAPAAAPVTPSGIATPPAPAKPGLYSRVNAAVDRAAGNVIKGAAKRALPAYVGYELGDALKGTPAAIAAQETLPQNPPGFEEAGREATRPSLPKDASPREILGSIRLGESGGKRDARNPLSGATGRGQMTETTFLNLQKKTPDLKGYTWKDYAKNPELQDRTELALVEDQQRTFKNLGIPNTVSNHTIAWFGGPKLLQAPDDKPIESVFSKKEIEQNPTFAGKTVGEVKKYLVKRPGGKPEEGWFGMVPDFLKDTYASAKKNVVPYLRDRVLTPENIMQVPGAIVDAAKGALPVVRDAFSQGIGALTGQNAKNEAAGATAGAPSIVTPQRQAEIKERVAKGENVRDVIAQPPNVNPPNKPAQADSANKTAAAQFEGMQIRANELAAKKNKSAQDIQDQKDVSMALLQMGAAMMASKNPYFLGSLGEGVTAGLAGHVAATGRREDRETKRAAQQETARSHRATEANNRFQAHLKALAEEAKRNLGTLTLQEAEEKAYPAAIRRLSAADRAVMGFDEEFMRQYGSNTGAPAALPSGFVRNK